MHIGRIISHRWSWVKLRPFSLTGLIKCVSKHSSQDIYTRALEEQPKDEKDENKPQKQEKQKKQSKAEKAAAKAEAAEENA